MTLTAFILTFIGVWFGLGFLVGLVFGAAVRRMRGHSNNRHTD